MKMPRIFISLFMDPEMMWMNFRNITDLVKAPISSALIIMFLTLDEQGIWFTFFSLSAVKTLFDLGFSKIIMFAIANQRKETITENNQLVKQYTMSAKLSSLVSQSLIFFIFLSIVYLFVLQFLGYRIFSGKMYYYWQIYSIGTSLIFLGSGISSIYMGMNFVKTAQKTLFISSIIQTFVTWIFLINKSGILSLGVGYLISGLLLIILLVTNKYPFIKRAFMKRDVSYNIFKDLYKFQLKYILSWISGYAITNLLIIFMFKFVDGTLAGKYGLTFTIIASVINLSNVPISAKIPTIAQNFGNNNFRDGLSNCIIVAKNKYFILVGAMIAIVLLFSTINYFNVYTERFLGIIPIVLITLSYLAYDFVGMISMFVRSFMDEPFYKINIVFALICICLLPTILSYGITIYLVLRTIAFYFFFVPLSCKVAIKKYRLVRQSV